MGHAGTLDPLAEGVLPVLLGRATRLADYIQSGSKTYVTTIALGAATDTDDAEGTVTSSMVVPSLSAAAVDAVLAKFRGEILQRPPAYSALKVAGRRAYALARAGESVDLAPRSVTVYDLRLIDFSEAELRLEVTCSKGTYIRALARDIAEALGTVGHMSSLVRTHVGPFSLENAVSLEGLADAGVHCFLLPASCAIRDAPCVSVSPELALRLENGQPVASDGLRADSVWVYDPGDRLVCLASADGSLLRPRIAL